MSVLYLLALRSRWGEMWMPPTKRGKKESSTLLRVTEDVLFSFFFPRDLSFLPAAFSFFFHTVWAPGTCYYFWYSPELPSRLASVDFVVSVPQSKGSISNGWSNGLLNQFLVKEGWYSMRRAKRAKPRITQRNERNLMRGTTLFSWKRKRETNTLTSCQANCSAVKTLYISSLKLIPHTTEFPNQINARNELCDKTFISLYRTAPPADAIYRKQDREQMCVGPDGLLWSDAENGL